MTENDIYLRSELDPETGATRTIPLNMHDTDEGEILYRFLKRA